MFSKSTPKYFTSENDKGVILSSRICTPLAQFHLYAFQQLSLIHIFFVTRKLFYKYFKRMNYNFCRGWTVHTLAMKYCCKRTLLQCSLLLKIHIMSFQTVERLICKCSLYVWIVERTSVIVFFYFWNIYRVCGQSVPHFDPE